MCVCARVCASIDAGTSKVYTVHLDDKKPLHINAAFIACCLTFHVIHIVSCSTDNTYIEVLDSTRVHPETYEWARKMAVDALEYDEVHFL